MANDSTNAGQVSSEQDTTPINDGYFADMQGDGDAFFGPEQLAQASAGGAPVVVPVPQDQNVIRVQVTPGEILELSSPFDPGATLLGREADGNLAIRVGDVTVILVGFVEANAAAPVVVETSDGQPVDIAVLLASTDPAIDIQTAAGPGEAPAGQGADNTGGILAQLANGNGLGGLTAVGGQDQTELSYGLIDNSIRLDRDDALTTFGATAFRPGMGEAFLHDPIITFQQFQGHFTFDDFMGGFTDNSNVEHDGFDNDWADNDGTFTEPGDITNLTGHSTLSFVAPAGGSIHVNLTTSELEAQGLTSNGVNLKYVVSQDGSTIFAFRGDGGKCGGDGALIFVVHLTDSNSASADVEYFLVNRLDHATPDDPNDSVRDLLSIDVGFQAYITPPEGQGEGSGEGEGSSFVQGTVGIGFEDDVPMAHEVNYTSYYGNDDAAPDDDSTAHKGKQHGHESFDSTADGKAYVDEDWLKPGNKDHDNNPSSSNSDPAHGDEVGRAIAKGNLNIDFGADGPAGADGNDCTFDQGCGATLVLGLDTSLEAGFVNEDGKVLDSKGNVLTSDGHELEILSDCIVDGVEHLIVGYKTHEVSEDTGTSSRNGDLLFTEGASYCDVPVFELSLDVNPDDTTGKGMHFQDFEFELYKAIDQDPDAPTTESNTDLQFKVIGHDDDGDAVHTAINVQVNDDSPTINYISGEGANVIVSCQSLLAALGDLLGGNIPVDQFGLISSHDKGYVDEDWVNGFFAQNEGNADQDNTVPGSSSDKANGDDVGLNLVVGKVDFGADGPSATKIAELDVLAKGDIYHDKEGNTYTSGDPDKPLIVLFSNENFLVVGTEEEFRKEAVVETDDGLPVINGNVVFVVAMDNDPSHTLTYGGFVFYLNGAIDHAGQNEQNLIVHVGITAEDADGDSINAINIQVNDDKPSVVIEYTNDLEHSFLPDGETETDARLASVVAVNTTTDYGRVDEDWLKAGNSFTLHYSGNQDKAADGITSNANLFGDDTGKSEVRGKINVNYGADGPSQGDDTFALETYSLGTKPTAGPGFIAAFNAYQAALPVYKNDGQSLFSGGVELRVLESEGGHLVVGIPGSITPGGEGGTIFVPDQKVFEINFDSADRTFDFKQWAPLDHPIHSAVEDNINLSFNVGSITDGDGDKVDAVIKIQVNDDTPETSISYTSNKDTSEDGPFATDVGMVDEDFIGDPPANTDNDNNPFAHHDAARGDTFGTNSCYGAISTVNFGADGPGDAGSIFALAHLSGDFKDADDNPVTQGGQVLVVLDSTDGHLAVGLEGGSPVFELNLNNDGTFNFQLYGPLDQTPGNTDPIENNLMLAFDAGNGATDGDGDPVAAVIKIQVNDDAPVAVDEKIDFSAPNPITGNIFDQAKQGADGARINLVNGIVIAAGDSHTFIGSDNSQMVIFANGSWTFTPGEDENGRPSDQTFTYTITDGDGDSVTKDLVLNYLGDDGARLASVASGPTHEPAPHYDHDVTVAGLGLNGIALNNQTYHFEDPTGGHVISGGGGDDYINVTGDKAAPVVFGIGGLNGNGGDDIIHGGGGKDLIHGGAGDDTIYGGNNDDELYGDSGHDAMDGGAGNDKIHVDADDLDGTNTLDGTHSIDGGDGTDTVDLSVLKTFDSNQAMHLENVETLAFEGKAAGGGGTAVTLNYGAAYGITEVGGLHQLSITGDKSDTLNLQASGGNAWHETGVDTHTYEAGIGASKVTVTVDHDIAVQVS